jgi:hypothetical protein
MNAELAASRREFNGRMDAMESRLQAGQRDRSALLGGIGQVAQTNVMTASR